MDDAFDKVTFRGRLMDNKTAAFLRVMESKLGYELTVLQGCYSNDVDASAGTHGGGGVVDLAPYDYKNKVKVAADLGAFAWYRPRLPGVWGAHIHLGIRGHGRLSAAARRQQQDWDAKPPRNGLKGHAKMGKDEYHPGRQVKFEYPILTLKPVSNNVTKARDALVTAHSQLDKAHAHLLKVPKGRLAARAAIPGIIAAKGSLLGILKTMPKR